MTVFRPGEVFVREGPKNTTLRHAHWTTLLVRHDEAVRQQARQDMDVLLSRLAGSRAPAPVALLEIDAPDDAFATSVRSALDTGAKPALTRLLDQCCQVIAANNDHSANALHKAAVVGVEAISVDDGDMADKVIETIYQAYLEIPSQPRPEPLYLKLATYVYAIGGMATRKKAWGAVRALAMRPGPDNDWYRYSSWIRHMQVEASRADLFSADDNGLLISAARQVAAKHPELRPDIVGGLVTGDAPVTDRALNSLCQFDFLYCVWVFAQGKDHGEAYPSCSAFDARRLESAFVGFTQSDVRRVMFEGLGDEALAAAFREVATLAERQSLQLGRLWRLPATVASFLEKVTPPS